MTIWSPPLDAFVCCWFIMTSLLLPFRSKNELLVILPIAMKCMIVKGYIATPATITSASFVCLGKRRYSFNVGTPSSKSDSRTCIQSARGRVYVYPDSERHSVLSFLQSRRFSDTRIALSLQGIDDALDSSSSRSSSRDDSLQPQAIETTGSEEVGRRKEFLHESLRTLGVDPDALYSAAIQSIEDPTVGYDGRYGKSAIKTYRAFLFPKKKNPGSDNDEDDPIRLTAAARRCAQQIDFLLKRHQSHITEWVRHHDTPNNSSSDLLENDSHSMRRTFPIVLLLDNVRSAFNVGSLFRTADATGCAGVYTTGITPHPYGSGAEKLRKSALGAEYIVASQHFTTTLDAIRHIRNTMPNYQIIGMETTQQSILYTKYEYPLSMPNDSEGQRDSTASNSGDSNTNTENQGTVLVLGNEVTGVDTNIFPHLDAIIEIPMFGVKNSLNVAACAPVVLYEIIRQHADQQTKRT